MNKLNKLLFNKKFPSRNQEEKFQSLLNTINGCEEFILNDEGFVISTNLESVNITGYEEWELIGRHFSTLYVENERLEQKPEKDLVEATKSGLHQFSGFKQKKRGQTFWAKVKIQSLINEEACVGYRVVLQDATSQAMYSLSMRSIKEEYLQVFNNPYFGIFKFKSTTFELVILNQKATELLKGIKTISLRSIFENEVQWNSFYDRLLSEGKVNDFEFSVKGDNSKIYSISCKEFKNQGIIEGVLQDISHQKNSLKKLQDLKNELDTFLYRSSHDLRAPLTSILGLSELIRVENNLDEIKNYNSKIKERINGLDNLLRGLSMVAFNNVAPLHYEVKWLSEFINQISDKYKKRYTNTLFVYISNISNEFVSADFDRLGIVLDNIFENAFKFSAEHNECPAIEVQVSETEGNIKIDVKDNGPGIAEYNLKNVFDLFFKASFNLSGSGLGLFLVKSVMEKLNGIVHLNSELNKGTQVILYLPKI
jgi:PAS domain S-box-containing protein